MYWLQDSLWSGSMVPRDSDCGRKKIPQTYVPPLISPLLSHRKWGRRVEIRWGGSWPSHPKESRRSVQTCICTYSSYLGPQIQLCLWSIQRAVELCKKAQDGIQTDYKTSRVPDGWLLGPAAHGAPGTSSTERRLLWKRRRVEPPMPPKALGQMPWVCQAVGAKCKSLGPSLCLVTWSLSRPGAVLTGICHASHLHPCRGKRLCLVQWS